MKPTPGPWEIDDDSQRIDGLGRHYDYQAMAHAQLIATAPELYDALESLMLQALQSTVASPGNEYGYEALNKANAVLAKARGETN